ncbi:hypothetical protein N7467_004415 [Penicillium canescens]|nr:hypothetical protein N7467_004415 [Penicillium canescens]
MPSQAATGCIGAALSIGIGAVINAYGGTGTSDALIPIKRAADEVSYVYTTYKGVAHNFINTSALYHDWHHVYAIDPPMNLTVRNFLMEDSMPAPLDLALRRQLPRQECHEPTHNSIGI